MLAILQGAAVNSEDLRRVIGHITGRLLLRRPLLSLLHAVYVFVNAGIVRRVPVWKTVWDEIRTIRGMLVFAFSDLRLPFSSKVSMFDACLSGYGIGESEWSLEDVQCACDTDERWRFRDASISMSHREEALAKYFQQVSQLGKADVVLDTSTVLGHDDEDPRRLAEDFAFPNIHAKLLQKGD